MLARGGRFERAVTPEITHLVLVHPPGTEPASFLVKASVIRDPAGVLEAVRVHGGGMEALKTLRRLIEHEHVSVREARCACVCCTRVLLRLQTGMLHESWRPFCMAAAWWPLRRCAGSLSASACLCGRPGEL